MKPSNENCSVHCGFTIRMVCSCTQVLLMKRSSQVLNKDMVTCPEDGP